MHTQLSCHASGVQFTEAVAMAFVQSLTDIAMSDRKPATTAPPAADKPPTAPTSRSCGVKRLGDQLVRVQSVMASVY